MISRRALMSTSLSAGLAASVSACGRDPGAPPDTLRVAVNNTPDSLDPAMGQFAVAALAYKQIHAGLTDYAADGSLGPGLAEDWSVSDDGLRWTFRLREGLLWSDGTPLTAEDVVWSARRLVNPRESFADLGDFFAVENARAVLNGEQPPEALGVVARDARTVEFRLTTPLGLFPILMREFYPFPRHAIERHGDDWTRPANLVTAGAYTVEAESQQGLRLVRNENFYDADQVAIARINMDAVRDDATRVRLFRSGDYDLVDRPPANQIAFLQDELGARFRSFDAPILRYLKVNHARPDLAMRNSRARLNDAIDRDFIARELFSGTAQPSEGVIRPGTYPRRTPLHVEVGPRIERPLQLRSTTGVGERIAIALAEDWRRVGVETELLITYPTALYQAVDAGDFDIAVASFNRGLKSDPFFMLDPFEPDGLAANFNWDDPRFAELMDIARRESDPALRADAYARAESYLVDEIAIIPLVHERAHWLVSDRVGGTRTDVQPQLWRNLALMPGSRV